MAQRLKTDEELALEGLEAPPLDTTTPVMEPGGALAMAPTPPAPAAPPPAMPDETIPAPPAPPSPLSLGPLKDFTPELQQARDLGAKQRLISGIGRAGATIGAALGHMPVDSKPFDTMEAESLLPEKQVESDRTAYMNMQKLQAAMLAAQAKAAKETPGATSDAEAFIRAFPVMAKQIGEDNIRNMSPETRRAMIPIQDRRAQALATQDRFDKTQEAQREGRDAVQNRFEDTQTGKLAKAVEPFAELASGLKLIDERAPGLIFGHVPKGYQFRGLNKAALELLPQGFGSQITPEGAVAVQTALKGFRDLIVRHRTGAVLNASEEAFYKDLLGEALGATPEKQAIALDMFRRTLADKMNTASGGVRAGHTGEDLFKKYGQVSGFNELANILNAPSKSPGASNGPAPATQTAAPSGDGVLRIDKARYEKAKAKMQPNEIMMADENGKLHAVKAGAAKLHSTWKRVTSDE